jgi:hypothetical protein
MDDGLWNSCDMTVASRHISVGAVCLLLRITSILINAAQAKHKGERGMEVARAIDDIHVKQPVFVRNFG